MRDKPRRHLKKAQKAKDIIKKDFAVLHSVKELAEMGITQRPGLQNEFKMLYGKTVSLY